MEISDEQRKSQYYKLQRRRYKKRRNKEKRKEEYLRKQKEERERLRESVRKELEDEKKAETRTQLLNKTKDNKETEDDKQTKKKPHGLKEVNTTSLVKLGNFIGAGTFGTCQLASYRSMTVVIKEFKTTTTVKEIIAEATTIKNLGDHPGLPLLFGVQTSTSPYSLILQFHCINGKSMTLAKAVKATSIKKKQWLEVIEKIGGALQYTHEKGYLHNDMKSNNVVLEDNYNPVIIDFGKSTVIGEKAKKKNLSQEEQLAYAEKYPHIAPEIINGSAVRSIASDVYSLAKLIQFITKNAKIDMSSQRSWYLTTALSQNPKMRPAIKDLIH